MRLHTRSPVLTALLAASLFARAAAADPGPGEQAARLAQEGQAALDAKDWATAANRFTRAEALARVPFTLGLARAQVGLGKWLLARRSYERLLQEGASAAPDAALRALDEARRELNLLVLRIPSLTLQLTSTREQSSSTAGPGPCGRAHSPARRPWQAHPPRPRRRSGRRRGDLERHRRRRPPRDRDAGALPGRERAAAAAEARLASTARRGAQRAPRSAFRAPPAAPSEDGSGQRATVSYVTFGLGGVGLLVGTIAAVVAVNQHADLSASAWTIAAPSAPSPSSRATAPSAPPRR